MKEYKKYKEQARAVVIRKIIEFNASYNFNFGRISIRNQKTRWGSCSKKGNLNFNYRLVFIPDALVDYIIVHELCHLGEFNHSKNFWNLVARTIPDHAQFRKQLRQIKFKK
jgi:predicted metal-dependent hydrolase